MSSIEEKIFWLRGWLRYHGDYSIKIDLWGLYGCFMLYITFSGTTLLASRGNSVDKQLDEAIEWCKVHGKA